MITIDTNTFPTTTTPIPPPPPPFPITTTTNPNPPPRVRWLGYCASIVTTAQRLYVFEYPCQSLPDWWVLTSMATTVDRQWYFSHMFVTMIMCVLFDIECVLGGNILTTTIKFQFFLCFIVSHITGICGTQHVVLLELPKAFCVVKGYIYRMC